MLKLLGVVYQVSRDFRRYLGISSKVKKSKFILMFWKVQPKKVIVLWKKNFDLWKVSRVPPDT